MSFCETILSNPALCLFSFQQWGDWITALTLEYCGQIELIEPCVCVCVQLKANVLGAHPNPQPRNLTRLSKCPVQAEEDHD